MSSSRRRPERRLSIAQGRDAREIQLPPSAGKCFLLTSPFIERMRHIILRSSGLPRRPWARVTDLGDECIRVRLSAVASLNGINRGEVARFGKPGNVGVAGGV